MRALSVQKNWGLGRWGKFLGKYFLLFYVIQAAAGFVFGAGYTLYLMYA
ncbi:MAG: hypothetical protein ACR2PZ_11750 [Pseudomonadales bacterium]